MPRNCNILQQRKLGSTLNRFREPILKVDSTRARLLMVIGKLMMVSIIYSVNRFPCYKSVNGGMTKKVDKTIFCQILLFLFLISIYLN